MKKHMKKLTNYLSLLLIFLIISNNLKADGFWESLWNGISSPFRPVWGSYTVSGQNNSAPIALFKRTTFIKDKEEIIKKLSSTDKCNTYLRCKNTSFGVR